VAAADEPFNVAVTVAAWFETRTPVLAVNVAELALAAKFTEVGTVNRVEALLASATTVLLVVDFDRVTVQVVRALEARLSTAHCSQDMVGRVASESVAAWDEPFVAAVTVAVWSAVKAVAVARNVPLLEPVAIVSDPGTVRLVELELRPMVPPLDPLRTTVQVLEPLGAKDAGLHVIELIGFTAAATLTVPPVPVTVIASPVGEAPRLLTVTGRLLLPDSVTDTVATTPLEIVLEFNAHATQV
jgi:hypothetical protein